jgi:hypothetical protein
MKIEIHLDAEIEFGLPKMRCCVDENAPFFDGDFQPIVVKEIGVGPGFHELVITHYNKQAHDQSTDSDGKIIKDKHIEIKKIIIDDIALLIDELREGHFYPVYNPDYVRDCQLKKLTLPFSISPNLYLGHNGTWKLNFHAPFVEYIIEKRKNLAVNLDDSIFYSDATLLKEAKEWFLSAPEIKWKS